MRGEARAAAVAGLALLLAAAGHAAASPTDHALEETARAAIIAAVESRLRGSAHVHEVRVDDLAVRLRLSDGRSLVATLTPDARFGARQRVTLKALGGRGRGVRLGEADCVIRVRATHLQVVSPIARGDQLPDEAVRRTDDWIAGLPLWPLLAHPAGTRALRALTPGDVVTTRDVLRVPDVRSGDAVQVRMRFHSVEVGLQGVAAQDGHVGDDIRIVNPSSGRLLRARVTGPGSVEVHHGS